MNQMVMTTYDNGAVHLFLDESELPDDDPDLVAGMEWLSQLRSAEAEVPDPKG